jgi:hypothetical protein
VAAGCSRPSGFSNAIRVLDAPTPEQDPDWSPEDVTINVIRWLPEERVNAMGPRVDPRSGERCRRTSMVWPSVIDYFGSTTGRCSAARAWTPPRQAAAVRPRRPAHDPGYIVAHEVGHTLGLMHNQLASTAYSVASRCAARVRQPLRAQQLDHGLRPLQPGAQPGDGVTQLWGKIGPTTWRPSATATACSAPTRKRAARTGRLRRHLPARPAPVLGQRRKRRTDRPFRRDPRVQTENTGAERVEATRLGVANLLRSLRALDAGTAGDAKLYASTYDVVLGRHVALLKSVNLSTDGSPAAVLVPAAEQRAGVRYLLGEGAASLEAYANPAVTDRITVYGGSKAIEQYQADLVSSLMTGEVLAALDGQAGRDPNAYSALDFARDLDESVWGSLNEPTPTRRALQRGWISGARTLLGDWTKGGAGEGAEAQKLQGIGAPRGAALALVETGDDTLFVTQLRESLPGLKDRLDAATKAAKDDKTRLYLREMSAQVARLAKIGAP